MFLAHIPLIAMYTVTSALVAGAIVFVIRRFIHLNILASHHEVGFPIFLQIGVVYGVVLAFMFSTFWGNYFDSYKETELEATHWLAAYELSRGLSDPTKTAIVKNMFDYQKLIISKEWQELPKHHEDQNATKLLQKIQYQLLYYNPKNERESILYEKALEQITEMSEYRRLRLFKITEPSGGLLIAAMVFYGVVIVSISYIFGMRNMWIQACLTGALAALIASIITMIYLLTQPYSGRNASIHNRVMQEVLNRAEVIEQINFKKM